LVGLAFVARPEVDALAIVFSLALPLAFGGATVCLLRDARRGLGEPGEIAWIAGAGYFVGAFALTLWMRALSLVGVRMSLVAIAVPFAIGFAALAWLCLRRYGRALVEAKLAALRALLAAPGLGGGARIVWWIAVAWLVLRFLFLGLEVGWQPLYPWDAWTQWATKARIWFELGHIVPFKGSDAWFARGGDAYFDAAPGYPPTAPLLQVWTCIALGRWDDALMNWPWWQIAVSLALAVYGGLRRLDASALAALAGAFFVASLPLANVHVALAGYADLPLAAWYSVAVLAFLRWHASRDAREATLAALLALACTQIKNPGIFWAATLVPGAAVALAPRHAGKIAAIGLGAVLAGIFVLAETSTTVFNYRLHLEFDPAWATFADSLFLLGNWNLLWYAAVAVIVLARRELIEARLAPLSAVVASGALFLFFAFGFTNARAWVTDQSTVNRATLHFAPLVVVFVVLGYRAFSARWAAAHEERARVAPAVPAAGE
jgi:hypothetical protein